MIWRPAELPQPTVQGRRTLRLPRPHRPPPLCAPGRHPRSPGDGPNSQRCFTPPAPTPLGPWRPAPFTPPAPQPTTLPQDTPPFTRPRPTPPNPTAHQQRHSVLQACDPRLHLLRRPRGQFRQQAPAQPERLRCRTRVCAADNAAHQSACAAAALAAALVAACVRVPAAARRRGLVNSHGCRRRRRCRCGRALRAAACAVAWAHSFRPAAARGLPRNSPHATAAAATTARGRGRRGDLPWRVARCHPGRQRVGGALAQRAQQLAVVWAHRALPRKGRAAAPRFAQLAAGVGPGWGWGWVGTGVCSCWGWCTA